MYSQTYLTHDHQHGDLLEKGGLSRHVGLVQNALSAFSRLTQQDELSFTPVRI